MQAVTAGEAGDAAGRPDYSPDYGETDLLEGGLRWQGGTYVIGGFVAILLLLCGGGFLLLASRFFGGLPAQINNSGSATITPIQTIAQGVDVQLMTNTPFATLFLPTVTPAPPTELPTDTPAPSPTQGPCIETVQPNDDLISIIYRCGHRTLDILDSVVELNNLNDAASIQLGQEIEVPWPTLTPDPNMLPSPEATDEAGEPVAALEVASAGGDEVMGVRRVPTATLQPGVTWHTVQPNDNILIIASQYGATLRILSDLNPEVTFSQCDFGSGSGGENCSVFLSIGQQLRVPAPTPTPTIQPTASGSETPTPTATATFNAPTALSPGDRAFFGKDELITLRWVATGSLMGEQSYLVRVEDLTADKTYTATTQELSFIIPEDWHVQEDVRHDYRWSVSVIDNDNPDQPYFTTEPRLFTWQGRGG